MCVCLARSTSGPSLTAITRYIDEAQDNLLIDAPGRFERYVFVVVLTTTGVSVIRSLSNNPKGFFWAGDTAQTISAGSSFRFDDLKAFLYEIEVC